MGKITIRKINVFTILILIFVAAQNIFAVNFYVGQLGVSGGNYFTNIQLAVNAATDGDTVIVSNGTYGAVSVTKGLTIQSVNGLENTIIDGNGNNICLKLHNYNTEISGFTITNGYANQYNNGGGIQCSDITPVIRNCVIVGNSSFGYNNNYYAGGVYFGTFYNCTIRGNNASYGGGTYKSVIRNCVISGNSAEVGGGVVDCNVYNSVIAENLARKGGGTAISTINNCTIVNNTASEEGGATWHDNSINNSIVYYNKAPVNPNRAYTTFNYCCTTPEATSGTGNISAEPMLLSSSHIAIDSPCVTAGLNSYKSGVDIDGENWRITPSIGCDEPYVNALTGSLSVAINAAKTTVSINWPLTFTVDIEGKLYRNIWTFDDGAVETNKYEIAHSWNATGEYNVVLTAFNDTYPDGISNSIIVKVVLPTYYVNINNSTPIAPYKSWETAATNIQDAVDVAYDGGKIFVTNGHYLLNNQIDVNKNLIIQSIYGPKNTIVDGNKTNRCFNLYSHNTIISGFTVKNGGNSTWTGGGINCIGTAPIITNCIITGNNATYGGGIYHGTVINSILSRNSALSGGGARGSTLYNCLINRNSAVYGGGTLESVVNNCTIIENVAEHGGGTYDGIANNSIVYYNHVKWDYLNRGGGTYNYCCTTIDGTNGVGNISAQPLLLSFSHISTNSPCIGAGSESYSSGVDVDGELWKNSPSIGCDEVYANAISGSLLVAISADKTYTYANKSLTFYENVEGKLHGNIWTFDDGTAETNKISVAHSWDTVGEYNVILTAFNETYPGGVSNILTIKVITNAYYVNVNNPVPVEPYASWETAATNIQDAVDVAIDGGKVFVTNGFYLLESQIDVDKNLIIQSITGSEKTIIDGNNTNRCFKLYNHNTVISGFTIENGNAENEHGGGIYCSGNLPEIKSCIITDNSANSGGGVYYGTIDDCIIINNSARNGGGVLGSIATNSVISKNSVSENGGGAYYGKIYNCEIINNFARNAGGIFRLTANNSAISKNFASVNGGGAYEGTVNNCTISGNTANGIGGGTYNSTVNNSIVYYNDASTDSNRYLGTYNYSCTTPDGTNGSGNISLEPILLSTAHISTNSPCIGAGSTNYITGVDFDGEAWKNPPSIGCDEVYANAISGLLSVEIIADETNACIDIPLTFYADIEGKLYQNIWTFDDGTAETNKSQVTHSWRETGEYNVFLTAFNETYPSGVSNFITVVIVTNVYCVDVSNLNPVPPYSTWETAATNILDAVEIALTGGKVFVTNGHYLLDSQIDVDKDLLIQSVTGPENTIIDGNNSNRCFILYNHNTMVSGFTITNGNAKNEDGGGIHCSDATPVIKNCVISGNIAHLYGGGIYRGTIYNCKINENYAEYGGGVCYGMVNNSLVFRNSARYGGGICEGTNNNCTIIENSAIDYGGGAFAGVFNNSIAYYNSAPSAQNRYHSTFNYCCTTPDSIEGTGNIVGPPMLISASHIATNSPCISAGSINYTSGVDLDGEMWKSPPSIGCDEVYANAITGSLFVSINVDKTYAYISNSLTFWANIEGKLNKSSWSFDDGVTEENKYKTTHFWNSTGEYNVILTAFNNTYPDGVSATNIINILESIHYVNVNNSTPSSPYTSWETAATNIQDAVDLAVNYGTVFVTNGYYLLDSQIDIDKNLTIQSINGAENTIIDGNNTNRCFNLHNYNVTLVGFTITNGNARNEDGGGIYCSGNNPVISKCIITGNSARWVGGAVYSGTVKNSLIYNNSADKGGGGFYSHFYNCTITKNYANSSGGATFYCDAYNSIIYYNLASSYPNARHSEYHYCCTTPDSISGTGNIVDPPLFENTNLFNYRLKSTSPCINAGNNSYAPIPVDLDGNPRIIEDIVDMGCYEFPYSVPQIAANALIFPAAGSELYEGDLTNIIWDVERIFDSADKTNLTITKISVCLADLLTESAVVTNDIQNILGEIQWCIPNDFADAGADYVLEFEVVNSSSITNSRIFWDNEFTIVPEPMLLTLFASLIVIWLRRH